MDPREMITGDEAVAAIVREYGAQRRKGIPCHQAIVNTAAALEVRPNSVTLVVADRAINSPRDIVPGLK